MVRRLLFAQLGVIAALAVVHIFAMENYLYWRLPWLDLVTHFLGGIWAALFAASALALENKQPTFVFCVGAGFVIAGLWEALETFVGISYFPRDSFDTIQDMAMGLVGAFIGTLSAKRISRAFPSAQ